MKLHIPPDMQVQTSYCFQYIRKNKFALYCLGTYCTFAREGALRFGLKKWGIGGHFKHPSRYHTSTEELPYYCVGVSKSLRSVSDKRSSPEGAFPFQLHAMSESKAKWNETGTKKKMSWKRKANKSLSPYTKARGRMWTLIRLSTTPWQEVKFISF